MSSPMQTFLLSLINCVVFFFIVYLSTIFIIDKQLTVFSFLRQL